MEKPGLKAALQPCTTTFQVTVFRSRETKQVLFLEAGKDFVDTLLSFLVLPMGTIINILSQGIQGNSLGGISCMLESLDSSFLHVNKNHLVKSPPPVEGCTCQPSTNVRFQQDLVTANMMHRSQWDYYPVLHGCSNGCGLYSRNKGARCGVCNPKPSETRYVFCGGPYSGQPRHDPTAQVNGYVKENMRFLVTDKLEIITSSMNTSMSLLKKLELTSLEDTESDEITVSITQIVELLHSALISKTCLNDVFGKKREDSDFSLFVGDCVRIFKSLKILLFRKPVISQSPSPFFLG